MKIIPPELVSPAGDWTSLLTAVENGADSVYFGIQGLNMRNLAGNFQVSELKKVMRYLHRHHKKGYLALNVIVYDRDVRQVERILKAAKAAQVDAVILWDMAVMSLAKKIGLRVHLSTQASVANSAALKFYHSLGVRRVVLARECTLAAIRRITRTLKRERIKCEIETFVHGAMCVSISGRCFLSQEAFGKSANRGECQQPCRREYLIREADGNNEYLLGQDYVLSPKDLCAIDLVDDLIRAGVRSFKIEGRMRSAEYIKVVTSAYRRAIDAFAAGKLTDHLKQALKAELAGVYNRGFSTGFFFGTPLPEVSRKLEHTIKKIHIGEVRKFYGKLLVADVMIQEGVLKIGDQILISGPRTPASVMQIREMQKQRVSVTSAQRGEAVGIKLDFPVRPKDQVFLWQKPKS